MTAGAAPLLEVLAEVLEGAIEVGGDVEIRPFASGGTHDYFVTGKSR